MFVFPLFIMHPLLYAASNPYVDVPVVLTIFPSDAGSFCTAGLATLRLLVLMLGKVLVSVA